MRFSFDILWRSRTFWIVLGLFALANARSALVAGRNDATAAAATIGFPFPFHSGTVNPATSEFYLSGLLLDLVVAWTAALVAVWIVRAIRGQED